MQANVRNAIFFELKVIKEYWQIISIITTILFFGIYFYLENKDSREKVQELVQTNKELKDRISRLEGQIDVINSNMVLFVEKNPGLTTFRLEMLEEQMEVQQLVDQLNRRRDSEIKIIQIPVPYERERSISMPSPIQEIKIEPQPTLSKKKTLFKKSNN